jgi:hypothetical protein
MFNNSSPVPSSQPWWKHRIARLLGLILAVALLVGSTLLAPALWEPYVRVQNETLQLKLLCVPATIDVVPHNSWLRVKEANLLLQDPTGKIKNAKYKLDAVPAADGTGLTFTLTQGQQGAALAYQRQLGTVSASKLAVVQFERVPYFTLDEVRVTASSQNPSAPCGRMPLRAAKLSDQLEGGKSEVLRYRRPQEDLSNIILSGNELIGSIIVACMIVAAVWLLARASAAFFVLYLWSDVRISKSLGKRQHRETEVRTNFMKVERELIFWRVTGPAAGFLLTVSSLIAGLHPSKEGASDSFVLISALQLALVATFLGLMIRILAEVALRFQRRAAERKLMLSTK